VNKYQFFEKNSPLITKLCQTNDNLANKLVCNHMTMHNDTLEVNPSPSVQLMGPFATINLDKDALEPFWRQLYVQITGLIKSGEISEGVSLPSERDLALAMGISRATVKRCYDELRRFAQLSGRG
jgi:Bacterial regulatory proteins, gntR family